MAGAAGACVVGKAALEWVLGCQSLYVLELETWVVLPILCCMHGIVHIAHAVATFPRCRKFPANVARCVYGSEGLVLGNGHYGRTTKWLV
jgi:hypothetical protein